MPGSDTMSASRCRQIVDQRALHRVASGTGCERRAPRRTGIMTGVAVLVIGAVITVIVALLAREVPAEERDGVRLHGGVVLQRPVMAAQRDPQVARMGTQPEELLRPLPRHEFVAGGVPVAPGDPVARGRRRPGAACRAPTSDRGGGRGRPDARGRSRRRRAHRGGGRLRAARGSRRVTSRARRVLRRLRAASQSSAAIDVVDHPDVWSRRCRHGRAGRARGR